MQRLRGANGGGIPAYAGMTMREGMTTGGAGVTITEGGMDGDRRQTTKTGRAAPCLPTLPGPRHSRESGNLLEAPRPTRSTLSRRVRGVLSPSREKGISALARRSSGLLGRLMERVEVVHRSRPVSHVSWGRRV